ncbi:hypothetical protein QL285_014739 [Trifolium repens]|nr:hypothetical protein QL285_014739 [Trifolium repens]
MNQMNWCELEATRVRCKEHPNDKQIPGVCSSCLRDKLSQLYTKNPVEPLYNCSPSSPASPQAIDEGSTNHGSSGHRGRRFRRNASHATGSASCMISFNHALNLKKSKSLAVASRNRVRDRDVGGGGGRGRKKDGFWSKVLKLRRKDTEETVVNSRT